MVKFLELFVTCLKVIDSWAAADPNFPAKDQRFASFVVHVMKAYEEGEESATELLSLLVRPAHPSSYSNDMLEGKLKINANARLFRVVFAANARHGEDDFRVRRFIESISSNSLPFHHYATICSFFTESGDSTRTKGKKKTDVHGTLPATRLEKLLFVAAIAFLSAVRPGKQSKKSKVSHTATSADSVLGATIPSLTSLKDPIPQRIGYVVQSVVSGWANLATFIGFKDLESLLIPYVVPTLPAAQFKVLSRDEGFARKDLFARADIFSESSTKERAETFTEAFDRSEAVDAQCRQLCTLFLEDLLSCIKSDTIYAIPLATDLQILSKYFPRKRTVKEVEDLPSRFHTLDSAMLSAIRSAQDGNAEELESESEDSGEEITVSSKRRTGSDGRSARGSVTATAPPGIPATTEESTVPKVLEQREMDKLIDTLSSLHRPLLRLHDVGFDELLEADEMEGLGSISGQVQLVLTDPPYNVRRERDAENAHYDAMSKAQMKDTVELISVLLRAGGHAVVFCTVQQFAQWSRYFTEHKSMGKDTFSVDKVPMVFSKHPSAVNGFPGRRSCSLQSSAEFAIHLKKNGLEFNTEATMVNYRPFNFVPSTQPAYTNVMDNIPRLMPGEQLRVANPGNQKVRTKALRPEQKSAALLRELVSRFSQPKDLVVDLFGGTFSTAVACISLPEHRRFIGCEMDAVCFSRAFSYVYTRLAEVIHDGKTDIDAGEESIKVSKLISEQSVLRRVQDPRWRAPSQLPQFQCLPGHIVSCLATRWGDTDAILPLSTKPFDSWKREYQGKFQGADMVELRNVDASFYGVCIADSNIRNKKAGLGVFAVKAFQKGDQICPFYGTLIYHDLEHREEVRKAYAHGAMEVSVQRFRDYALQITVSDSSKDFSCVRDRKDGKKAVFVCPARFCVGGYVNDYHHWEGDEDAPKKELGNAALQRRNAIYTLTKDPIRKREDLVTPYLVIVEATRTIAPGEEILVDYAKHN